MSSTFEESIVKKSIPLVTLLVIAGVSTALLTGCTTDGGSSSYQAQSSTSSDSANSNNSGNQSTGTAGAMSSQDLSSYISVTGAMGAEPQFGKPQGTPPADLAFQDLQVGTGAAALPTSTLTVHYKLLTWSDGQIADSSWKSGTPATFPLANVVQGWQQGLPGMKVGGRRLLFVPPALGYGSQAYGPIAANETLVFVVDLIAVK